MPGKQQQPTDMEGISLVTSSAPTPSVPLKASADPEFNALALAPIPPVLGTDTDAARQFYRTSVSQIRMPPLPSASRIAQGAQAATQVIYQVNGGGPNTAASSSTGVDLQVNNVDNPVQSTLNLTGPGVSYGPAKGQVSIFATIGEIQNNGTPVPSESALNFLSPMTVIDDPGNGSSDVAVSVMVGDSGSGGVSGLVPAAPSGSAAAGKYLKADGTFEIPPGTGGAANYQTVESAGTPEPQEPTLNFLSPFIVTDNPGNTSTDISIPPPGIAAFTYQLLASPVNVSSNTTTQVDSITVHFPSAGGPWYARVTYFYAKNGGDDYLGWANDGTYIAAIMQGTTHNNNGWIGASSLFSVTYANSATKVFSVYIYDAGATTVVTSTAGEANPPPTSLSLPSYMQVEVIAAG